MKRRFKTTETDNPDRWVVSYADFITLMFAFFTALYAISQVDVVKLNKFAGSMREAFKAGEPPQKSDTTTIIEGIKPLYIGDIQLERNVREVLNKAGFIEGVTISSNSKATYISLSDFAVFDKGSPMIREEAKPLLNLIADIVKNTGNYIVIEGHTDNLPMRGSQFPTNWELSTARATSVLMYFIKEHRIPPERLSASGYGEYKSIATNATPEGRAKNRRVDILFLSRRE